MTKYNGHPSWTYWNVSLWVNNDEGLYNLALDCLKQSKRREDAARSMLDTLHECGSVKTPDGAPYSVRTILHSMRGMER